MKIISWNVNGIRAIVKKDFDKSVARINPDILCLQETKAQVHEVQKSLFTLTDYQTYINSAERKGYSGTAVLTKPHPVNCKFDLDIEVHDKEGRVITLEYDNFYLVNVYTPNSGAELVRLNYRKEWDKDFRNHVKKLDKKKPVIICGDLNVAHQPIDLKNPKSNYNKTAGYTQVEIDGMSGLLNSGFIDTFRYFHPDEIKYSWWSYRFKAREKNIGWRIDYVIVSERIIDKVKDSFILNEYYGSDHCPVGIEIDI